MQENSTAMGLALHEYWMGSTALIVIRTMYTTAAMGTSEMELEFITYWSIQFIERIS